MFNCLFEASLQKIEAVCQCSASVWVKSDLPPCEGVKKLCMTEIMDDIGAARHVQDGGETKECLVACHDQTHQLLTTSAAYPNQESFHLGDDYCLVLNKLRRSCKTEHRITLNMKYPELCSIVKDTFGMTCQATRNSGNSTVLTALHKVVALYARENLSVLDIYIKDPYVKLYMRREKITVISFIGNIGGLLGLFLGFSFISAVEIIYVFLLSPAKVDPDVAEEESGNKIIKRGRTTISASKCEMTKVGGMATP